MSADGTDIHRWTRPEFVVAECGEGRGHEDVPRFAALEAEKRVEATCPRCVERYAEKCAQSEREHRRFMGEWGMWLK